MTTCPPPEPEYTPMRPGLFQRWLWVWHVIYVSGLLVVLGLALADTWGAWGWREAALVAIVAILIAAYTRLLVFELRWPYPNWVLVLYFSAALGLLALAAWLHPFFIYVIGMLFGQMFGILPPVLAVPGAAAVLGVILLASNGWQLPRDIGWGTVLFVAGQLGLMLMLYLYVYHVFRTSQERAGLVNELRAANEQLERARAQASELAALRERERVARDLHDGLGHTLVALSLQLEAIQRLYPVDPVRASAQVDDMKRLTRDSMAGLRGTLEGLRVPGLGDEPLPAALDRLCAGLATRAGLDVAWRVDDALDLPRPVAEALWRVAQEALLNVERHAGATAVRLNLAAVPGGVELVVSDDGAGLPPDAEARPGHYGLRGLRERVEGLGGTLSLESNGSGALIRARLPRIGARG